MLTLRILNFMQVYLTFAVMAICTLLVVALVHVIYLLHEKHWIKFVHGTSLVFFSLPFLAWAVATVSPGLAPRRRLPHARRKSVEIAWYANVALLVATVGLVGRHLFVRQSGEAAFALFTGLYEEPLNFIGVGLFLTVFVAVFHWFGLSVMAFGLIFLAFAEEYSKHLIVRFTDDDSIRVDRRCHRILDHRRAGLRLRRERAVLLSAAARRRATRRRCCCARC